MIEAVRVVNKKHDLGNNLGPIQGEQAVLEFFRPVAETFDEATAFDEVLLARDNGIAGPWRSDCRRLDLRVVRSGDALQVTATNLFTADEWRFEAVEEDDLAKITCILKHDVGEGRDIIYSMNEGQTILNPTD